MANSSRRTGAVVLAVLAILVVAGVTWRLASSTTVDAASAGGAERSEQATVPSSVGPDGSGSAQAATSDEAAAGPAPDATAPASIPVPAVPGAVASPDPNADVGVFAPETGPGSPRPPLADVPAAVVVTPVQDDDGAAAIDVTVTALGGSQVYGFEARLCSTGADIRYDADFNPSQGGNCIAHPLGERSDVHIEAVGDAPYQAVTGRFRVAAGRDSYVTQAGTTAVIECGAGRTCLLALKIQVPDGFGFRTEAVTF